MFTSQLKTAEGTARKFFDRRQRATAALNETRQQITAIEGEIETLRADLARAEVSATLDGSAEGLGELRKHEAAKQAKLSRLQALAGGLEGELTRTEGDAAAVLAALNLARDKHVEAERGKLAAKIRNAFEGIAPLLRQYAAEADGRDDAAAQRWIQGLKVPDPEDGRPALFEGQRLDYSAGSYVPVPVWHGDTSAEKAFARESGPRELAERLDSLATAAHQRQSAERRAADDRQAARRPLNGVGQVMYTGRSGLEEGEEEPRPASRMQPMVFHPNGRMEPINVAAKPAE